MNEVELQDKAEAPVRPELGGLDAALPADMVRAFDAAMHQYFGTNDWLNERTKVFPGLTGQYWFSQAQYRSTETL